MGCCMSKHDAESIRHEAAIAEAIENTHQFYMSERPNPPIVITKEHTTSAQPPASTSSSDSRLPTPINTASPAHESDPELMAAPDDPRYQQINQVQFTENSSDRYAQNGEAAAGEGNSQHQQGGQSVAAPPVVIEERTQEHNYGDPPEFDDKIATIKSVKPIVIMQPTCSAEPAIVPAVEIPEARDAAIRAGILPPPSPASQPTIENTIAGSPTSGHHDSSASNIPSMKTATTSSPDQQGRCPQQQHPQEDDNKNRWPIFIRKNTSATDDLAIDIPTTAPEFMTVAELRKEAKENLKIFNDVKLIHKGRVLQDHQVLMPANQNLDDKDYVKVSKRGVIQLMMVMQRS